jgi:hypothetical protein
MMKTFTQKLMLCVGILALMSTISVAQTFMVVNSPDDISGDYTVVPGVIGLQGVMSISGDLALGEDGIAGGQTGTETDGCEALTNDVTGKIVVLDRGECSFFVKGENAEAAGAIALLVCNNVTGDPIAMGLGANGEGADIGIPCYMASLDDCNTIKMSINSGETVNVTIEERERDCEATYDDVVFWGQNPGEGDFNNATIEEDGWESVNLEPLDRPDVKWIISEDGNPINPNFFGGGTFMDSPTGCDGIATFSAIQYSLTDNPNPGPPPYPNYSAELISPTIDCSGKDSIVLEFYSLYNNLNNDNSSVSISVDGGDSWEQVALIANLTANTLQGVLETERFRIPLPQFDNQPNCKIKFTAAQDFYYWSIDDVTLRSGTFFDTRANNFFAVAQNYYGPANQPSQIPFLIDVQNLGNSAVGIDVTAQVLKGTEVIHEQMISYPSVAPGFTEENRPFPETFTPPAEPGEYTVRYTVSSGGDSNLDNNVQEAPFILEENGTIMSKLPIDYANLGNWGIGGQSDRSYGAHYVFPRQVSENGNMITVETITAGISQDEDNPPIEGFLRAEIFRWFDTNDNQMVEPDERVLIGIGQTIVLEDGTYEIALEDVNDEDAKVVLDLDSGEGILAMIHHRSLNTGVTWRPRAVSTGDPLSTTAADLAFDTLGILDASIRNVCYVEATGSSPDDIDERTYTRAGQLSYYCPITLGEAEPSSVNDFDATIGLEVFPNPTSDFINLEMNFEETVDYATVSILDNTGRFVRGMKFEQVSNKTTSIDLSNVASGVYTMKIATPNGFTTKQFIVTK